MLFLTTENRKLPWCHHQVENLRCGVSDDKVGIMTTLHVQWSKRYHEMMKLYQKGWFLSRKCNTGRSHFSLGAMSDNVHDTLSPVVIKMHYTFHGYVIALNAIPLWYISHHIWYAWHSIYMMTSSNGSIFRVTGHLCGEFTGARGIPSKGLVTRSFDVFFDMRLNQRLSKQWWGWWFETLPRPLWRHCNKVNLCSAVTDKLGQYHGCWWPSFLHRWVSSTAMDLTVSNR